MRPPPTDRDLEAIDLADYRYAVAREIAKHALYALQKNNRVSALEKLVQARHTEDLMWQRFPQGPGFGE